MRRFLVCTGVHGRPKSLEWLRQAVEHRRPEGILFAGGVLDTARHYAARTTTAWGLTHEDALFLEQFFKTLGKLRLFSAIIPGPGDTPVEDFLRMGMHAEIEFPDLHLVHATLVEKGDIAICGIGGLLADAAACEREICSRTMAEYHLRPLWVAKQPHKILLLAVPPTGALGGAEGCTLAGQLLDSYHPSLCVVAGPSERRGTQRVAHTLVLNPGHLAEGWAAWLDWNREVPEQVEFVNLRDLESKRGVIDIGVGD
jgi:Icc-related predicted phosphoesterase